MFVPHSFVIALIMMIASAVCWGSWANTYKGVRNYRFELFYWDYALGIFLISLVLAFTMGSTADDPSRFLTNVHNADNSNIASTMFAGIIFNLANLLLVAAIDMAGLAIAFPVANRTGGRSGVQLHSSAQRPRGLAGCRRCVRFGGGNTGRKSLREFADRQSRHQQKEHHHVRGLGNFDGRVGALCDALDDAWKYAGPLQRGGVLDPGGVALLFCVEHLFHEASLGWASGEFCGIFSRTGVGPCSWFAGRRHLGNWYGVQSGGREFHGRSNFVCDWAVGANGSGAVGRVGLEGISRRRASGVCLFGIDVCVLFFVHFGHFLREYRELICFLLVDPQDQLFPWVWLFGR